jgi:hypothetical protein
MRAAEGEGAEGHGVVRRRCRLCSGMRRQGRGRDRWVISYFLWAVSCVNSACDLCPPSKQPAVSFRDAGTGRRIVPSSSSLVLVPTNATMAALCDAVVGGGDSAL